MNNPNLKTWIEKNNKETSYDYWNNEEIEKNKIFYLNENKSIEKLKKSKHLNEISAEFERIIALHNIDFTNNKIFSLGSGTGWIESNVLKKHKFKNLNLLDFSKHRIFYLAPKTVEKNIEDLTNINFIHGSMYDLKIEDSSIDFFILSQAFHHAHDPLQLLGIMKQKLKINGLIIIIGEPYFNFFKTIQHLGYHLVKYLINYKSYRKFHYFLPSYNDVFPPDKIKGDNHYSIFDYHLMFKKFNFEFKNYVSKSKNTQSFILLKK